MCDARHCLIDFSNMKVLQSFFSCAITNSSMLDGRWYGDICHDDSDVPFNICAAMDTTTGKCIHLCSAQEPPIKCSSFLKVQTHHGLEKLYMSAGSVWGVWHAILDCLGKRLPDEVVPNHPNIIQFFLRLGNGFVIFPVAALAQASFWHSCLLNSGVLRIPAPYGQTCRGG